MDFEPRHRFSKRTAVHDSPLRSSSQVRVLEPWLDLEGLPETLDVPACNGELTQLDVERTFVATPSWR